MEEKLNLVEVNHFIMELATEASRVPPPSLLDKLTSVMRVGKSTQDSSREIVFVPEVKTPAPGSTNKKTRVQESLEEAVVYADHLFQRRYYHRVFDKPEDLPGALTALDFLCQVYSQVGPKVRSMIRKHMAKNKAAFDLVWYYQDMTNSAFRKSGDPRWLERHLLVISIIDLRTYFKELYFTLGGIYIQMTEAGIDPQPYFTRAANLSNPKPNYTGRIRYLRQQSRYIGSMRDFFLDFDRSAFFAETILPLLGGPPKQGSQ